MPAKVETNRRTKVNFMFSQQNSEIVVRVVTSLHSPQPEWRTPSLAEPVASSEPCKAVQCCQASQVRTWGRVPVERSASWPRFISSRENFLSGPCEFQGEIEAVFWAGWSSSSDKGLFLFFRPRREGFREKWGVVRGDLNKAGGKKIIKQHSVGGSHC